jgi:hypothetical protein
MLKSSNDSFKGKNKKQRIEQELLNEENQV